MPKSFSLTDSLNAGIALLQENKLEKAEEVFLGVLQLQADNPHALHLLGVVKQEQGQSQAAVKLLERAVQQDDNISYVANLCNSLIAVEDYAKAEQYCTKIIATDADYGPAYYHMARIYFFTKRFDEAVSHCLTSLKINKQNGAARLLLAQVYSEQEDWEKAKESYQQLLENFPATAEVLFGLGLVSQKLDELALAEKYYKEALTHNSDLSEAYNGLGSLYFAQGHLQKAYSLFYQALKKNQKNIDAHYNQGLVLRALGRLEEALVALQHACQLQPDHCSALSSMGLTLQELNRTEAAQDVYEQVLLLSPDHGLAIHMLSALSGVDTAKAPTTFVADLFDAYASSYEQHLQTVLEFNAPTLIATILQETCQSQLPFAEGVDLGCGTGLMAEKLGPMLSKVDGIDLSARMLDIAKAKNIYRTLVQADIADFLQDKNNSYDLCVASDVFIYIGDLHDIFALVATAMKQNGVFVFTTEDCQNKDFELLNSGRYAHSVLYITALAEQYGFHVQQQKTAQIRKEDNVWLPGHVYVLQRSR